MFIKTPCMSLFKRDAHSASPLLEAWRLGGLEDRSLRGAKRGKEEALYVYLFF